MVGNMIVAYAPVHLVAIGGERRAIIGGAVITDRWPVELRLTRAHDRLQVTGIDGDGALDADDSVLGAGLVEHIKTAFSTGWLGVSGSTDEVNIVAGGALLAALFDAFGLAAYEPQTERVREVA
jgi:hypothetical protein